ncbi:MsnO8 family LLM class oxidoreductase [Aeribacillus sp. FSL K6-2848]|uniref:MsnO8 family LLM class oxidoreductase n=1 Tax=Aeribacillus TaxID=1055323 RepID=UPI0028719394|nr:MsnO8 family LLM class oxidoreductase [Aeribacillus pallidus]MED1440979.1 MsnO8 family LLM class oxidoreductase [Aeribacillus composti]
MSYELSILDQSPIFPETSAAEALQETVNLAKNAEKWGYLRFWLSEHHYTDQLAGASPEILISYLLAHTKTIRVGSGGVLLQHYSPYKVAENFHVLSNLAPGRVDLGIGKAPGGLPLSTRALQYGTLNDGSDFESRFSFLKKLIEDSVEESHPLAGIQATPLPPIKPELILLGASASSAKLAAEYETPFVYGLFFNSDHNELERAANIYHELFPKGRFMVGIGVVAAPEQQEAELLARDYGKIVKVTLQSGRTVRVLTMEQGELFGKQSGEPYKLEEQDSNIVSGTPSYVFKILNELHLKLGIDEFILHTPILKKEERFRSFELLSPQQLEKGNSSDNNNAENGEYVF